MRAHALQGGGLYFHFGLARGAFGKLSFHWGCPVRIPFLRLTYPMADLLYFDLDAFLFPDLIDSRIAASYPAQPVTDHFVAATDPNGPVNLGWLCIRKGGASRQRLSSSPRTEEDLTEAFTQWRRVPIPAAPPVHRRYDGMTPGNNPRRDGQSPPFGNLGRIWAGLPTADQRRSGDAGVA